MREDDPTKTVGRYTQGEQQKKWPQSRRRKIHTYYTGTCIHVRTQKEAGSYDNDTTAKYTR